MNVIDLEEWAFADPGAQAESIARLVLARGGKQFEIREPSALTGAAWGLRSCGLVGYLPLGGGHALRIAPKVPVRCLLAMLDIADLEGLDWHDPAVAEASTVDGLFDVLARLLARKVADRVRKGLHRAYLEERDELQVVRGRILPRESMARQLRGATALVCEYESLTEDLVDNQILLWTLERLRRAPLTSLETRRQVRASHRLLAGALSLVPFRPADCDRSYDRLNADYRPMHVLCRLLLDACGDGGEAGDDEIVPFTIWMPLLFERYVARWLARVLTGVQVSAHEKLNLSGLRYDIDVVIRDPVTRRPLAVLDTKYKDDGKPAADDVQQVVFYATVLGCTEALLVYPRPVVPVTVNAGPVTVRTLGLDLSQLPAADPTAFAAWAAGAAGRPPGASYGTLLGGGAVGDVDVPSRREQVRDLEDVG